MQGKIDCNLFQFIIMYVLLGITIYPGEEAIYPPVWDRYRDWLRKLLSYSLTLAKIYKDIFLKHAIVNYS